MKKAFSILLVLTIISTVTFGQTLLVENNMSNKELVKTAITEVFINGHLEAVDKYWSENYIQHNPQVSNGRDALKKFLSTGINLKYEMGLITEDGNFVMVHARITGLGPKPMIVVDIFRIENGQLAEHWDVIQEEVPENKTVSGNAMFPVKIN